MISYDVSLSVHAFSVLPARRTVRLSRVVEPNQSVGVDPSSPLGNTTVSLYNTYIILDCSVVGRLRVRRRDDDYHH